MDDQPLPSDAIRPGEVCFDLDPSGADDARLVFIGRIASPFQTRDDCPKNIGAARARGAAATATIEIAAPFRAGLADLETGQYVHLLTWLGKARRDLAVQSPRHAERPRSTFSLRSPVRPNPIGLHLVRILAIDASAGRIAIDAIDVLDGTALLDIKPFFATVDVPPDMT